VCNFCDETHSAVTPDGLEWGDILMPRRLANLLASDFVTLRSHIMPL
jgi:hypothetical protein